MLFSTTQADVTSSYHIVYMSGQIEPLPVPISNVKKTGGITTIEAIFPYEGRQSFSRGLTVAALVRNGGPFVNVPQVADATMAGPALIQVNYD